MDAVTGAFSYSGAAIAAEVLRRGRSVRTLTNHPPRDRARVPAELAAVDVAPLDLTDPSGLRRSLAGVDTLYNTYWVRFPHGPVTFESAIEGSAALFAAAADAGVRRVVHVSITHADPASPLGSYASPYTWWRNTYGLAAWLPTPSGVWIYDETYYAGGSSSKSGATFRANATMRNDSFLYWVLYTFGPTGWAACGFPTSPRANFYFNESITAKGSNFGWTTGDSKSGACTNLVHHNSNIGGGYA